MKAASDEAARICHRLERKTGLEPATFSLARRCSTNLSYFRLPGGLPSAAQRSVLTIASAVKHVSPGHRSRAVACLPT